MSTDLTATTEVDGKDAGDGGRTGGDGGSDARAKRRSGMERDEHVMDGATATLSARGKIDFGRSNRFEFRFFLPLPRQLDRHLDDPSPDCLLLVPCTVW